MRYPILLVAVAVIGLEGALASPHSRRASALDKPAVKPPFPEAIQNRDLQAELPLVGWRREIWEWNWLPKSCAFEANETGFHPADFEAAKVWYEDCAASWTICRHKLAEPSFNNILDVTKPSSPPNIPQPLTTPLPSQTISRIPVGMRQYIDNLILLPPQPNTTTTSTAKHPQAPPKPKPLLPAAYTRTATIVVTHTHLTLGVLLHEIAHILDSVCPTLQHHVLHANLPPGTPFSDTPF